MGGEEEEGTEVTTLHHGHCLPTLVAVAMWAGSQGEGEIYLSS